MVQHSLGKLIESNIHFIYMMYCIICNTFYLNPFVCFFHRLQANDNNEFWRRWQSLLKPLSQIYSSKRRELFLIHINCLKLFAYKSLKSYLREVWQTPHSSYTTAISLAQDIFIYANYYYYSFCSSVHFIISGIFPNNFSIKSMVRIKRKKTN